jgi:hypothetical protein
MECCAKASEWIYVLRDEPMLDSVAQMDIFTSRPEYRDPLVYLMEKVKGLTLPEYLQTFVVAADLVLNPEVSTLNWPMPWIPMDGAPHPDDIKPANRLRDLVDIISGLAPRLPRSKEELYSWISTAASNELGWSSPETAFESLASAVAARSTHDRLDWHLLTPDDPFDIPGDPRYWLDAIHANPYGRALLSCELRRMSATFLIAPISADLVNATTLGYVGFAGSVRTRQHDFGALTSLDAWYEARILDSIVEDDPLLCPGSTSIAYSREMYFFDRECPANQRFNRPCVGRPPFPNCAYRKKVSNVLGEAWEFRTFEARRGRFVDEYRSGSE